MTCRSVAGLTITPTGTSMSKISLQQIGECQRRQRIPAQVSELRVGTQIGRGRAEQSAGGPADCFQSRPVRTALRSARNSLAWPSARSL